MPYSRINILDAVTSTSVSDVEDVTGCLHFMTSSTSTGGPTYHYYLEGSVDLVNWDPIIAGNADGVSYQNPNEAKPFKYVRVNLYSMTGGSSPTVSVSVSAA